MIFSRDKIRDCRAAKNGMGSSSVVISEKCISGKRICLVESVLPPLRMLLGLLPPVENRGEFVCNLPMDFVIALPMENAEPKHGNKSIIESGSANR